MEALIYTTKGNLPVSSLVFSDSWEFETNGVTYASQYTLNGEIVRRDVARYQLPNGMTLGMTQGAING